MTTTDDELIDLLEAFGGAFGAQDTRILQGLFDDEDVCFVGSESLVLHDGSDLEAFFGAYAAQPASFSFEWDSCQVSSDDRWGWIVGFGRQTRKGRDEITTEPIRLTLVCRRRADGWRISHLHSSTPAAGS
ncbi:MAG: nuclear transport factor 2 family protein [Aeromicrobium sp.]